MLAAALLAPLVPPAGAENAAGAGAAAGVAYATNPITLVDHIREEAEYIMSMRDGAGIITTVPDRRKVVPYHANFAVMGLARAYTVLRDGRYATASWRWLEWYRDHMLADGTMPDWIYTSTWIPAGEPDSTDSYAGTYLSAVLATFIATGDTSRMAGVRGAVDKALDAIELTEDDDGLHFARPGWPFKYSMDEAEAYAGFRAAQQLGVLLRDAGLEARGKNNADRLLAGSRNLIDPATALYLWAIHDDGTRVPAPVAWIYPGASAQMWAIADGLSTGIEAHALIARVEAAQPLWDTPNAITQFYDGHPSCGGVTPCKLRVSYWPRFALAYLTLGNAKRALDGALRIRAGANINVRAFPFTPGDAGQLLMVFSDADVMAASLAPGMLPQTPL